MTHLTHCTGGWVGPGAELEACLAPAWNRLPSFRSSDPYPIRYKLNSVALVRERTMPTERSPLVGEVVQTFADRGCRVVSATDSHGR
jgi:hypothetical protein